MNSDKVDAENKSMHGYLSYHKLPWVKADINQTEFMIQQFSFIQKSFQFVHLIM